MEGQLQTRKWQDQTGAERYTTEVILGRFRGELALLDSKGSSEDGAAVMDDKSAEAPIDDDIPF